MIIDSHSHFTTAPPQLDAARGRQLAMLNRPAPLKLGISDELLIESLRPVIERMDSHGVSASIFSPRASGMGHEIGDAAVSKHWTQANNDLIARACELHPGRLYGACQLPQSPGSSIEESVHELERCVRDFGFVGCNINPDVSGGGEPFTPPLGNDYWVPLYRKMIQLGVPGLVHASSTRNPALHLNGSHYTNVDSSAVFELCWSGILGRYPELKLVIAHGGGSMPFQFNRFRALHVAAGKDPFEDIVTRLYFDTAVYDREAVELLIQRVGASRILYAAEPFGSARATDPMTGRAFDDTVRFIADSDSLSASEKEDVLSGNTIRLYSLQGVEG